MSNGRGGGRLRRWLRAALCLWLALASPLFAQMTQVRNLQTVSGTLGVVGTASGSFDYPYKIAFDTSGNMYVADEQNNRIQKVTPAGVTTTVAGSATGTSCPGPLNFTTCGDNGLATSALLYEPYGVAVDSSGNLYISDTNDQRVREVNATTGIITTIAGSGASSGSIGVSGTAATSCRLNHPQGLYVDSSGNVYISDSGNNLIREYTVSNQDLVTVAGGGSTLGDGGAATSALLSAPVDVFLDSSSNIYIADQSHSRIRKVTASTGYISTVAGNGTAGYTGDGGAATSAELDLPAGVTVDSSGNIYIADEGNNRIRVVSAVGGFISTLTGTGTAGYTAVPASGIVPITTAMLNRPYGVTLDSAGDLYIADTFNYAIQKIPVLTFATTAVGNSATAQSVLLETTAAETISSITATASQGGSQEFTVGTVTGCTVDGVTSNASGTFCTVPITFSPAYPGLRSATLTVVTSTGTVTFGLTGTGTGPLAALTPGIISSVSAGATLNSPIGVAVDSAGNLYIADQANNVVRKVTTAGVTSIVAGTGTACSAPAASPACGDGGLATSATLHSPASVAVDAAGNLYIADTSDYRVREVSAATGYISTIAGVGTSGDSGSSGVAATTTSLGSPGGIAVDSSGNVFFSATATYRVHELYASTGTVSTIAGTGTSGYSGDGGAATSAELGKPTHLALDSSGNVYIADLTNNRIRKVTRSTGYISTVAGDGTAGYSGDQGLATSAKLKQSRGVAVDVAGNIYVGDTGNNVIREVNAASGDITTIAGYSPGSSGYTGDGGAATSATLSSTEGLALDSKGNLYIADGGNNAIRKITVSTSALTFAAGTSVGSSDSADDPQTATVENIGNSTLTFPPPSSGSNPSMPGNFSFDSSSTCTDLYTSSSASTLAAGAGCTIAIDFAPTSSGTITGTSTLTDEWLNGGSTVLSSSTQSISLSGTGAYSTTTTITASANPSGTGAAVTFTATVAVTSGSATPAGTVQFSIDGANAGSAVTLSSGAATYATSSLTVGAVYTPSSSAYLTSTAASYTETISNQTTPTMTWATPSAITYGTALSSMQLDASASVAGTYAYNYSSGTVLGAGTYTLSVTFTPTNTTSYTTATASVTLTVNKATPTLIWATPSAINYGIALSSTQLNAASNASGTFVYSPAAGTVEGIGTHTLSVTFTPTDTTDYNSPVTASVTLTVNQATGTISLTSSAPSASYGTSVVLTATVASGETGTVTFMDGSTTLGTGTIASNLATLTDSTFSVGSHTLTAVWAGNTDYTAATSASLTQTITRAAATIAFVSSLNPSIYGDAVTLTITLSGANTTPTGTLTLTDTGTALATLTLSGGTASYSSSALSTGSHSLKIVYSGDGNFY